MNNSTYKYDYIIHIIKKYIITLLIIDILLNLTFGILSFINDNKVFQIYIIHYFLFLLIVLFIFRYFYLSLAKYKSTIISGNILRILTSNNKWENFCINDIKKDIVFFKELEFKCGKNEIKNYEISEQIIGIEFKYEINNKIYIKHQYFHNLTKEKLLAGFNNENIQIRVNSFINGSASIIL